MIRFTFLEQFGLRCAAMSNKEDGDCSWNNPDNRIQFCSNVDIPVNSLVAALQVHGNAVIQVEESHRGGGGISPDTAPDKADALITNIVGLPLCISIADCVPVLLFSPKHGVTGVVHAGREGTYLNIAGAAIGEMQRCFNLMPENLYAVIGPSAGPCCYEVDHEHVAAFQSKGLNTDGNHLDLWESNRMQLIRAGIPENQIETTAECTICSDSYYSFRRDKNKDRNIAVVML